MSNTIEIDGRPVGEGCSAYITAEIGINHNGDLNIATASELGLIVYSGTDTDPIKAVIESGFQQSI